MNTQSTLDIFDRIAELFKDQPCFLSNVLIFIIACAFAYLVIKLNYKHAKKLEETRIRQFQELSKGRKKK
jgi:hypothetical protein|nr:MAG TPA: hypothetical protein [Caudoviricetes sp.]